MDELVRPQSLDHVALWVADREPLADFLCGHLGMHMIERSDSFTLVGVDAKLGKLTLFEADGPREAGVLRRVTLRVSDLDSALAGLPAEAVARRTGSHAAELEAPSGLPLGLIEAEGEGVDFDLDHVVLRVPDPGRASDELAALGFDRRDGRLEVADRWLRLEPGGATEVERPLLNHLALLVESAEQLQAAVERRGLEVAEVVDAPNTRAVFLWGPDRIKVEYVEHKPGFALS
jgi:catechol 2,3-dioxygenase-like lactoylglutathione lyase family enzyme